jgi:hypothetical protein
MDKLVQEGFLGSKGAREYLNFIYIINELAMRYQWVSVLLYDREYRVLQARHGFSWGQPVDHLTKVFLKERTYSQGILENTRTNGGKAASNNSTRKPTVDLCMKYNTGTCTYNPCKFVHLCSMPGCAQAHPKKDHKNAGQATQQGNL